jgi:hypothetical protein
MKYALLSLFLLSSIGHAADVPFYLRGLESERDVSGINENFRSVVGDLTKLRADLDAINVTSTPSSVLASSSSMGAIPAVGPLTNGTLSACVVGSTLTITNSSTNGRIEYKFFGNLKTDSGGFSPFCSVLINGAFPANYSSTVGTHVQYQASVATFTDFKYDFISERLSGTTFSACLACAMTGGGGQNWYLGGPPLRASLQEVR